MSDIREQLRRMQRSQLLGQVTTTDRLIRQIYTRAARNLKREAAGAKDQSLTQRWAEDYRRAVSTELGRMNADIERAITRGATGAAEIRTDGVKRYMGAVARASGCELSDRFTDMLSHCRTDALRAMLDGKMYRDGRELSKRIWSATGRLEGAIEEIVAQGVTQQQSTYQIARALEAYVNPKAACPMDWQALYPDTPFHMNVDYNAVRLARTAINHVYWQTGINAAMNNPFCAAMHWELSNVHYERQVLTWGRCSCDEYAEHEEGMGRGNFAPENLPRPHPNCLCLQYEVLPTPEDAADRFRAWMDGTEDSELENGFVRYLKDESSISASRNSPRSMAGGNRRGKNYRLTEVDKAEVRRAIREIQADPDRFEFVDDWWTVYRDDIDVILVGGNVMPDLTSTLAGDKMSVRAVLAHEYYGHRVFRGTKAKPNSWNDEFRASYTAAINAPGLTDQDRADLINDAMNKAEKAGIRIRPNAVMRRILYGY